MTRKTLVILTILFTTLFIGSSVYANTGNTANNMGAEMNGSLHKLSGTVQNAGNNVRGAMDAVGNTMSNMMRDDNNNTDNGNVNDTTANNNTADNTTDTTWYGDNTDNNDDTTWFGGNTDNTNDTGYTATRTTGLTDTGDNLFGMNSTMWTWLILAVATIGIVTLVWFYGAERTDATHSRNK